MPFSLAGLARFETELVATEGNLEALADLSGHRADLVHERVRDLKH